MRKALAALIATAVTVLAGVTAVASPAWAGTSPSSVNRAEPHQVTAVVSAHRAERPRWYTVQRHDNLSKIAARYLGAGFRWEGLYKRNHKTIGPDFNRIRTGMDLRLANAGLTRNLRRHIYRVEHPPAPRPVRHAPSTVATPAAAPAAAPASAPSSAPAASYSGSYPGGAFGACVRRGPRVGR